MRNKKWKGSQKRNQEKVGGKVAQESKERENTDPSEAFRSAQVAVLTRTECSDASSLCGSCPLGALQH